MEFDNFLVDNVAEHWPECHPVLMWACRKAHKRGHWSDGYMVDGDTGDSPLDSVQADLLFLSRKQWTVIDQGDNVLVLHWGPGWIAWGVGDCVASTSLWFWIDDSVRDLL